MGGPVEDQATTAEKGPTIPWWMGLGFDFRDGRIIDAAAGRCNRLWGSPQRADTCDCRLLLELTDRFAAIGAVKRTVNGCVDPARQKVNRTIAEAGHRSAGVIAARPKEARAVKLDVGDAAIRP